MTLAGDGGTSVVSVIITTYNRPTDLENAIESVSEQTYEPIELVVVDDHSDTPAAYVLQNVDTEAFHRFRHVRHDENQGANAARNTGLDVASGEYIAFLDDDDQWEPEKIERQVTVLEADDDVGVVYTGVKVIGGTEESLKIPPEVSGNLTKALLCQNVVGTLSAVMVRGDIAETVRFDERFPTWADTEWYIRLSTRTRFERIADPLVIYSSDSSHRLSESFEKKRVSYELFTDEFDELAGQYGRLFRRKMHGWAAFRVGAAGLYNNRYDHARRLFTTALLWYPLEPQFVKHFLASLGGKYTHELARTTNRLLP